MKKEQVLIQEIHDAFDNAQDVLLEEAREIINANIVEDVEHIKKMSKLGFKNSKVVKEASEKLQRAVDTADQAAIIIHYREKYPFLKFLTHQKLDEICERYNLIYAPVERYLEDVPAKNLKEIETAQPLLPEDQIQSLWRAVIRDKKKWRKEATENDTRFVENWRGDKKLSGWAFAKILPGDVDWQHIENCVQYVKEERDGLFIAGPENHFNLEGLTKKGKFGFLEIQKVKVNDPIVFRYVRGGIQVLSKWGLEANDTELANPLDN